MASKRYTGYRATSSPRRKTQTSTGSRRSTGRRSSGGGPSESRDERRAQRTAQRSSRRAAARAQQGASSTTGSRRTSSRKHRDRPLRIRWTWVAVLVLVLAAVGLYYAPLREFFAQQDRYQTELAELTELKAQNETMERQLAAMHSKAWVVREARREFQLIPQGMQAFVITDLPDAPVTPVPTLQQAPRSLDLGERLSDLWDLLLR